MLSGPQRLPQSKKSPKQLVVFLHGYGSNGENLIDIADHWVDRLPDAEFISPNGIEPSEISPLGYQWFGLRDFSPINMRGGLEKAAPIVANTIVDWLDERQLTAQNLALVGFSQGTMLALELMFHIPGIRSILGYSGAFYPPIAKLLPTPYPDVCLIHGDIDTAVPYEAFNEAQRHLLQFGIQPKCHTSHGIGHSIDMDGIRIGGEFLQDSFSTKDPVIYMKQS